MWICPFFLGKPWGLLDGSTSSRGWKLCPIGVSRLDCRDGGRSFFFMGISSIQWDKGFWLNMTISYHIMYIIPSGKHTTNYGKSPFSMGKSTLNPPNNYSNWCFKHFLFSIIHGIILPIDKYVSRWLKPPTSHVFFPYCSILGLPHSSRFFASPSHNIPHQYRFQWFTLW